MLYGGCKGLSSCPIDNKNKFSDFMSFLSGDNYATRSYMSNYSFIIIDDFGVIIYEGSFCFKYDIDTGIEST